MPDKAQHLKKYEDNKCLLNTRLAMTDSSFYNWNVIVAFYAALHLVEAKLAEDNVHSVDHVARNNNVERFNKLKNIRSEYKFLYDRSRVARYDAAFMDEKKAKMALKCLGKIEEELHSIKPDD